MFLDVEVACGTVRLLPRGRIPEGHEEASILVVMAGLWNGLVCGEALLRPVDLELEGTDADHVPRDALRGREDDALRVRISHQPGADPILRIDREIGETGKFVSQPMRNRGFVFLFEKEVLLPAHRLDVFDVRLVGLSRHWKFDNARDG